MWHYAFKTLLTVALVLAAAEIAKRNTAWAGAVASLPIVSILAMVWLYADTGDSGRVAEFATSVAWLVIPSLTLFITLPLLLRVGVGFWTSLGTACLATATVYTAVLWALSRLGARP